jgi:hypothetical protein
VLNWRGKQWGPMTRSISFAALLVTAVAACAATRVEPPPVAAVEPVPLNFVPYCGQKWSVGAQGYIDIPCPPGVHYEGGGKGVR